MGWFDDQGVEGYQPYEAGGITGGGGFMAGGPVMNNTAQPEPAAPAFDPRQQVGHDGAINGMTREQYRDAWQSSGVTNNQQMDQWLAANGGSRRNDSGVVTTPFGETLDMGQAFKTGNGKAAWGGMDGGGGSAPAPGGGVMAGGGPVMNFSTAFGGGGGSSAASTYTPKQFDPFVYEKFDPSTFNYQDDPGVAVREKRGLQAMQNGAASKGTLLTGAFQKAMLDYGQESASQEYGNAFNRAVGVNQANNSGRLGAFNANVGADLGYGNLALGNKSADNQYAVGMANVGLGYANNALGYHTADQSYDLGLKNNALGNKQADNSYALGQGNLGLGWANFGLNADQQNFNQGYSLAGMGMQGAGAMGGYGSSYGNNAGNYATGSGNAQAAGTVASGNAWNNAFAGASNNAIGAYYAGRR